MQCRFGCPRRQPPPQWVIADLIVVLQECDKGRCGQFARWRATRLSAAVPRSFSLIGKSLGQRAAEMLCRSRRIVAVVTRLVAGNEDMQGVVKIVVPLRVVIFGANTGAHQIARLVAVILQHEMDFSIGYPKTHALGDLVDDVGRAVIDNCVNGIQTKPVEVKFFQPIQGIVNEKVAHRPTMRAREIEGRAPWRVMAPGEELGRDRVQIVTLRAEMIVDDVEKYREAAHVAGFDQPFQRFRTAIAGSRRIEKDTIIAPIAATGKLGDRHQFDRRGAERANMVEMRDSPREVAAVGESADMQLVKNDLLPPSAAPVEILPVEGSRIDDLAGAVNALRLIS